MEQRTEIVEEHLPKVIADIVKTNWRLEEGISSVLKMISDWKSDAPQMPEWFFRIVMRPMLDKKRLFVDKLEWFQPIDDVWALAGHFELIALFVRYKIDGGLSVADAIQETKTALGGVVQQMIERNDAEEIEMKDDLVE